MTKKKKLQNIIETTLNDSILHCPVYLRELE